MGHPVLQRVRVVRVIRVVVLAASGRKGRARGAGVDMRRMESRRVAGLFMAGEVLDIDGITGGYNFQVAPLGGRAGSA